jgi:hypothetical protein
VHVETKKPFQRSETSASQPERKPIAVPVPISVTTDVVARETAVRIEVGRRPAVRVGVPIDTPASAAVAANTAPIAASRANRTLYEFCDS